jgi:hypothetical protein
MWWQWYFIVLSYDSVLGFDTVCDDTDMVEECTTLMLGGGTFRHAKKKHNFVST